MTFVNARTVEQNVADRKAGEMLFQAMLDMARDDYRNLSDHGRRCFMEAALKYFAKRLGVETKVIGQPVNDQQPSRPHLAVAGEVAEAVNELEEIISNCEDVPDRGADFAESVASGCRSMIETIESNGYVTENQLTAIENWAAGINKWINR